MYYNLSAILYCMVRFADMSHEECCTGVCKLYGGWKCDAVFVLFVGTVCCAIVRYAVLCCAIL